MARLIAAGAMVLVALSTAAAQAAPSIGREGDTLVYRGDDEASVLQFDHESGVYYLQTTSGTRPTPGPGCAFRDSGGEHPPYEIRCAPEGIASMVFETGAGDDRLCCGFRVTVPAWADMGPGRDNYYFGTSGASVVEGGDGDDTLSTGEGNDHIRGGPGNDAMSDAGLGPSLDRLEGGEGDDVLSGNAGDDHMDAGAGNDRIQGDLGNDTLIGGEGDDILAAVLRTHDGALECNNVTPLFHPPTAEEIARLPKGDQGADTVDAGPGNDVVCGGPEADALSGGDGDDRLHALDQEVDARVSCGSGADHLAADPFDPVELDCDRQGQAQEVRARNDAVVRVPLRCPPGGCSGTLTVTRARSAQAPDFARLFDDFGAPGARLARRRFEFTRRTSAVPLRLTRRAAKRLRKRGETLVQSRARIRTADGQRWLVRRTFPLASP